MEEEKLTKGDKKFLELIELASEVVLEEDKELLEELGKR